MLPKNRHEDKDGGDEDDGDGDLRGESRGERLDLALGSLRVFLFMPAGESGQKQQANEGKDDGDDAAIA